MVEEYIRLNVGPRAVLRDFARTAEVLARYAPRLPGIVEAALLRQVQADPEPPKRSVWSYMAWAAIGAGLGCAITLVLLWLS